MNIPTPTESLALAGLIERIGDDTFPQKLLEWINTFFHADHLGIDILLPQMELRSMGRGSIGRTNLHKLLAIYYRDNRYARVDPAIAMATERFSRHELPFTLNLQIDHIRDEQYRHNIFERFNLAQRIMIGDYCRNLRFWIKLLRHDETGIASPEQMDLLQTVSPLLLSMARWHLIISQRRADSSSREALASGRYEVLLMQLNRKLSKREVDVCSRVLAGMSNRQIATDLGIAHSSVTTLRRRAYATLDVSSTAELFSLCTRQGMLEGST